MAKDEAAVPAARPAVVPPPRSQTSTLLSAGVQIVNSADIASIFTLFIKSFLHSFLEHTGRYFMFPINALLDLVEAGLAWYDAYKAHPSARTRLLVRASVASLFAVTITATVIVALTVTAAAPFIPFIFAGALGAKSLYHGGASLYFAYKGLNGEDPANAAAYKKLAKQHGLLFLSGALATVAVLTVMAFAHLKLAPIGIAAGAIGMGLGIKRGYDGIKTILQRRRERLAHSPIDQSEAPKQEQGTQLLRKLGIASSADIAKKERLLPREPSPQPREAIAPERKGSAQKLFDARVTKPAGSGVNVVSDVRQPSQNNKTLKQSA